MLYNIIIIIQVISALAIIALVLMQQGKGADMGAAFGAGSSGSGSLFGASGSSNFLSKSTAIAAVIFFVSTLVMAYIGNSRADPEWYYRKIAVCTGCACGTAEGTGTIDEQGRFRRCCHSWSNPVNGTG